MFNLEQTISEWRRQMLAAGIKTPVPLDELESHLRDEIEQQIKSGLDPQVAFNYAAQKIGQARALENEFQKVGGTKSGHLMHPNKMYPLLLLAWNTTVGFYFLPGKPTFALIMILASLVVSVLTCVMNRNEKFISVPSVTWPLLFIAAVVVGTAMLTGGIGFRALGSETMGGKRYLLLLAAVPGYFALVARRIPAGKADRYVSLFFLGALSAAVAGIAFLIGPADYFLFYFFPADGVWRAAAGVARFSGLATAGLALIALLWSRYGLQGVLNPKKYWRFLAFAFFLVLCLLGGYRSMAIDLALLCGIMFCMEGLFRTRLLPAVIVAAVLTGLVAIPFANRLPDSIQRSLSFLPLHLDNKTAGNVRASTNSRMKMWKSILPQVPHHLALGTGLGMDVHASEISRNRFILNSDTAAAASVAGVLPGGDFQNGPISVLLPFGIAGVIGFAWFLVAGGRVLYLNYKLGEPALLRINRVLFVLFITKTIMFIFVFGSFCSDMISFVGFVGLSIALNGGVGSSVAAFAVPQPTPLNKFELASG